jgi:hypothetical protein
MSKRAALLLIITLTASSLITIESAFAQQIPKPSVPEFTLKLVGPPYYVNTTYSLDPSTGQIVANIGYTNPYSALEINVKNQPFTPFTDGSGNTYSFYYNVRLKNHNSDDWVEAYHAWNYYPTQSTDSDYTNVGFSIEGQMGIGVLAGTQTDIQVEAMIGYVHRAPNPNYTNPLDMFPYVFTGETSGWSETQTISIPANTPLSPTPTPSTSPSQPQQTQQLEIIMGVAVVVAVIVAGLGLLIYLIKRK